MATSITASALVRGLPQVDGRFWVTETHTWDDGSTSTFSYLCDPATDPDAVMAARAAALVAVAAAALTDVPPTVTSLQARRAIDAAGLRAQVEAAVAAADADTQSLWYTAQTIDRSNAQVDQLGAAAGLTSDQIDQLFRAATAL